MPQIDWTSYAQVYDLLVAYNPAYRDILNVFGNLVGAWDLPSSGPLLDLGSGTGNFSMTLGKAFPERQVLCVDSDPEMNRATGEKAEQMGVSNLKVIEEDLETIEFLPQSVSGIVCVHALYTLADPAAMIRKMSGWIQPGGLLFVCDLGRVLKLRDWSLYLFKELNREFGLRKTLSIFYRGRGVMKQNRRIAAAQRTKKFWTHTHAEFRRPFEEAGLTLLDSFVSYRGYSDIIVCQKPANARESKLQTIESLPAAS